MLKLKDMTLFKTKLPMMLLLINIHMIVFVFNLEPPSLDRFLRIKLSIVKDSNGVTVLVLVSMDTLPFKNSEIVKFL